MKRYIGTLCVLVMLWGCSSVQEHHQQQQLLEQLQAQMESRVLTMADSVPFSYDIRMEEEEDGYAYELTLHDFEMAMYDVKVLALPLEADAKYSAFGFEDEQSITVLPYQENVDKGYYASITLKGRVSSPDAMIGVVVQWKDVSSISTYQRYWEIDCTWVQPS